MNAIVARLRTIHPAAIIAIVAAGSYAAAGLFIGSTPAAAKAPESKPGQSSAPAHGNGFLGNLPSAIPAQIPQTIFAPAPLTAAFVPAAGAANPGSQGSPATGGAAAGANKDGRNAERPAAMKSEPSHREENHSRPMPMVRLHASARPAPHPMQALRPAPMPLYAAQPRPQVVIMPRLPVFGGGYGRFGLGGGGGYFGGGRHR